MNSICTKCKYKDCLPSPESWNLNPHYTVVNPELPPILVIATRPTPMDIKMGQGLSEDHGRWMRDMIASLECDYIVDHAVRCYGDSKPSKKVQQGCTHWRETVRQYEPRVILCLGLDAGKVVLDKYNMTLAQLRAGVWDLEVEGHKCKVVVTDHPCTHSAYTAYERGGRDLRAEYRGVLRTLHSIAHGYYKSTDISYEVQDAYLEAIKAASSISYRFEECAFDVETANTGINVFHPDHELLCFGISFWDTGSEDYCNYVFHCREWTGDQIADVITILLKGKTIIGTYIQYDLQCVWVASGLELRDIVRRVHDTCFLSYLPNQLEVGNGLEDQCCGHLGIPKWKAYTDAELAKQKLERPGVEINYGHLPKDFLCKYQAMDVWAQIRVWREHYKGGKEYQQFSYVYELMINAMWALLQVERNGLPLNMDKLRLLREKSERTVAKCQEWLNNHPFTSAAGLQKVNVKSSLQLAKLAKATKIEPKFVSAKTGLVSMDEEEVAKWANPNGDKIGKFWHIVQTAIKSRDKISKFINKYEQHSYGGFARGIYSLTKTEDSGGIDSGRVGCRDLPNNTIEKSPEVRSCFECEWDEWLLEYDFSSAEPVILGILADCKKYHEIFTLKVQDPENPMGDLYKRNASKFWSKDMSFWEGDKKVWNPLRQKSKSLNLGLNYLMSPRTMSITYDIPVEECAEFYKFYFAEYPEIQLFIANTLKDAFLNKPCYSASGRCIQRDLSQIYDYNYDEHKLIPFFELMKLLDITGSDGHLLRKMVNFKIQSTTSDCMLAQLAWFGTFLHKRKDIAKKLWLTNPCHDSIWFKCKRNFLPQANRLILSRMENPDSYKLYKFKIDFPEQKLLVVEGEYGPNLGEKEPIKL